MLEKAGVSVVTASLMTGQITGIKGMKTVSDITLAAASASDYDAVVFIGGGGAQVLFNNPDAQKLAKDAEAQEKVIGAICIAPAIVANAGVLKGKKVTSFPSVKMILAAGGAEYTGKAVEVDGKVITANGPEAATEFGEAVLKALQK